MNETDFRKRIYTNPSEPDSDLLEAARGNPELSKILNETQALDQHIHSVMSNIAVPTDLQTKLLAIPNSADSDQDESLALQILADKPAANANYFQYFAIAASLVLAFGIGFSLTFGPEANPTSAELAFGNEVLQHMYHEEAEIAAINSGEVMPTVDMPMIRNAMAPVGTQLTSSSSDIAASVKFAKPCIIIPAYNSAHLIVQGSQGAVSLVLINNSPVSVEYSVNDERFSGIVIPMDKGNMILVGERDTDFAEYKKLFSENVDWII
jgi:hypothetical protein